MDSKWDLRFLALAKEIASWSKDPSTKVGAVIVDPTSKQIISTGYNGFPAGMEDFEELYADRETKLSRVIHGEINAILSARSSVRGGTLYLWPFISCDRCTVHIIQAGIERVVSPTIPNELKERWADSIAKSMNYYKEAGIQTEEYDF